MQQSMADDAAAQLLRSSATAVPPFGVYAPDARA
jgi:hypothetical protein